MTPSEIVQHIDRIKASGVNSRAKYAELLEFARNYLGASSSFYLTLSKLKPADMEYTYDETVTSVLEGIKSYYSNGLTAGISIERRAQLDVVSDYLEQAQVLLETKGIHPAAPCMLIGASLEEFLRNWVESLGLSLGGVKPGITAYSNALSSEKHIDKQDVKDLTSLGGLRNDAAHGNWDAVNDYTRIKSMLEMSNLFMRKYSSK